MFTILNITNCFCCNDDKKCKRCKHILHTNTKCEAIISANTALNKNCPSCKHPCHRNNKLINDTSCKIIVSINGTEDWKYDVTNTEDESSSDMFESRSDYAEIKPDDENSKICACANCICKACKPEYKQCNCIKKKDCCT